MLILILIDVQYLQNALLELKKVRIAKITPPQVLTLCNTPAPFPPFKKISDSTPIGRYLAPSTPYCYLENPEEGGICSSM